MNLKNVILVLFLSIKIQSAERIELSEIEMSIKYLSSIVSNFNELLKSLAIQTNDIAAIKLKYRADRPGSIIIKAKNDNEYILGISEDNEKYRISGYQHLRPLKCCTE